jgi:hypothetical protein
MRDISRFRQDPLSFSAMRISLASGKIRGSHGEEEAGDIQLPDLQAGTGRLFC